MGFSLKRFAKKAVKLGGKIAKPLLATTPVGKLALRGQQVLKGLGTNLKAARLGKLQPLSVRASVEKVAPGAAGAARTLKHLPSRSSKNGSRMPQNRKTPTAKGKRSPPKGGLDLKAMSARWNAAGKPGTWLGWIKTNPIMKPR
jgi:hypothetical protein